MRKKNLLAMSVISILVFLTASFSTVNLSVRASRDSWTEKAPMPTARSLLGVATVNGKIYAIGGSSVFNARYMDVESGANEEYDPVANVWTEKAPMPTPRSNFAIAVYGDKIYCIGGYINNGATVVGTNELYDPALDKWNTMASVPTPRYDLQANVVGDKIYLAGGSNSSVFGIFLHPSNVTEVYDPVTNSWRSGAPVPSAVCGYSSAVVGNKIYVVSGYGTIMNSQGEAQLGSLSLNQVYDPAENVWSSGAFIPTETDEAAACVLNGSNGHEEIYIVGGFGSGFGSGTVQVYDTIENTWSQGVPMPTARVGLGVGAVNNTFYAVGGSTTSSSSQTLTTNEQFILSEDASPISSALPSLTPTPLPTVTPSLQPSASPTHSQQINSSTTGLPMEYGYAIVAALVVVSVLAAAVYFRKQRRSKPA